jgi:K+-sensing histidine kinase KdpD
MLFRYQCPQTAETMLCHIADEIGGGGGYEPVTCRACGRIHLVNPKTGKRLEANLADQIHRNSTPLLKRTTMSLSIILVVTAILFFFKDGHQQHYLVFFYLFPIALVAVMFGSVVSTVCAIFAALVSAFLLYDPIYSLYVSDPRDVGLLEIFAVTGLIGAKYAAKLGPAA